MPQGFAVSQASKTEVICAYGTAPVEIPAVAATPGWQVIGEFYLPIDCFAQVDMLALVSDASLVCRVRLYNMTPGEVGPVSGSVVSTSSTTSARVLSGTVNLGGDRVYQYQAECTGHAADHDHFAANTTATLS